ncbi:hypothetical protein CYMTET_12429 [Cymbomonas tetramitiformis]|uniref:Uncharacterized protein n=1 Tax=Cymbomonas tetramitiformis TaxID=36881 RepID=A0AAE0GK48_9CHLO|nr:hypothetical protein CYMTET_12429 [Cymbomonas tetramitiformis]
MQPVKSTTGALGLLCRLLHLGLLLQVLFGESAMCVTTSETYQKEPSADALTHSDINMGRYAPQLSPAGGRHRKLQDVESGRSGNSPDADSKIDDVLQLFLEEKSSHKPKDMPATAPSTSEGAPYSEFLLNLVQEVEQKKAAVTKSPTKSPAQKRPSAPAHTSPAASSPAVVLPKGSYFFQKHESFLGGDDYDWFFILDSNQQRMPRNENTFARDIQVGGNVKDEKGNIHVISRFSYQSLAGSLGLRAYFTDSTLKSGVNFVPGMTYIYSGKPESTATSKQESTATSKQESTATSSPPAKPYSDFLLKLVGDIGGKQIAATSSPTQSPAEEASPTSSSVAQRSPEVDGKLDDVLQHFLEEKQARGRRLL